MNICGSTNRPRQLLLRFIYADGGTSSDSKRGLKTFFLDLRSLWLPNALIVMAKIRETHYWRISPGGGGFLWREQRLNECIALGWTAIGDVKDMCDDEIQEKFHEEGESKRSCNAFLKFFRDVQIGDKVVASASGMGIYALGTVRGNYNFNDKLEYSHSKKVRWETTFWHPVDIDDLEFGRDQLGRDHKNKFKNSSSGIIRNLSKEEWDRFCDKLNKIRTPFRNLEERGGLIQSPEYENEVIILFCHMLQHLHMRIISFGTRFPDAIVLRKKNGKWREENIEFELYSKGFEDHLDKFEEEECYTIVCWEDNWKSSKKGRFEIIELKKELEKIL